jgi:sugar lactone lactonase YvrE
MTNRHSSIRTIQLLFLSFAFILLPAIRARAGGPVIWETDTRSEMLGGESHGVSVTDTGTLMLAPRFTQLFNTEQAYVWSSAADEAGNVYLGTGHDGKIFRVSADGKGSLLYDAQELDVTALAVGRDGALYAGTSPDGKVYRITSDGKADVYFDPPDKYIWSLAFLGDGSLAVGTGDTGKLYRVSAAGAKPEASLLIDTNETHIISLAVDRQGNLIAGTDPGGLVIRVSTDGKAFALYDSPLREIHSLSVASDGSIYALALSDAATGPRQSSSAQASQSVSTSSAGGTVTGTVTVTDESGAQAVAAGAQQQARSRNELQNARSAVFRISPDGGADVLWSSTSVTAFSVAASPRGSGVLVGTSDKGRIYSVTDDGRDTLLVQSSEDQISTLVVRGRDVFAASSNQGKLFRFDGDAVAEGTYESPVRDAKFVATWGRIWWRGRGQVELQTRSGNTEKPDKTWSDWSAPYREPSGAAVASPRARFVQWRAVLRSTPQGGDASVEDVSLAYLPRNVAPEVTQIQVLPVGIALQSAVQIPVDPNVEASGLDPSLLGPQVQIPPRRMFQRGAVSLQWQAEDRNGDQLEYSVYYRPVGEGTFHLLKEHLRDNFYSTDGATLGDGRYVFKVVASDAPENSLGQALTGERVSEPVDVDSTPPVVRAAGEAQVTADGHARVRFSVDDASGMIRRADVSLDSGEWRAIFPEDGIADSPHETYAIDLPLLGAGEHTISLRAIDGSGNVGSARVVVRR